MMFQVNVPPANKRHFRLRCSFNRLRWLIAAFVTCDFAIDDSLDFHSAIIFASAELQSNTVVV